MQKKIEGKYEALFLASKDAIMTLEPPTWQFTTANPTTLEIFGFSSEADFTARAPWEYSPEVQPGGKLSSDLAKQHIMDAVKNGSTFFEWDHKRLNGEVFPATVLLTKTTLAGEVFLQATVRDITKEKAVLKELQQKIHDLELLHRATIDRELKIIKLKERVEKQSVELDKIKEKLDT